MRSLISRSALTAAALALGFSGAHATQTANGTLNVTATVTNTCTVGSSTDITFGSIPTTYSADVTAAGAISVTCPGSVPYTVGLGLGGYSTGSNRQMKETSSLNYVSYGLYQDSGHTATWDSTTNLLTGQSGTGSAQSIPVYGVVPAGQTLVGGSYSDIVDITVTY